MSRNWLIIGSTAIVLALAGCSAPAPTTDLSEVAAQFPVGTCIGEYIGIDSDRTTVVDCTEDHQFDVFGVDVWPEMAAEIAASDAGAVYDAITGEEASDMGNAYWDWAYARALPLYLEAIGVSDVTIDGKSTEELEFSPGALSGWDYSLPQRDEFVGGNHTTLFSATWLSPEGEVIKVSHPEGVTIADTINGGLPADRQGCFTRDPNAQTKYTNTACTDNHNGQYLAYVNGRVALGAEYMATVDPETTVFADYGPLDEYCTNLIDTIYPGLLDSANWGVWSDQYGSNLGWRNYDGTIDPEQSYPVYCAVLTNESTTTLNGDVISGDVSVSMSIG